MTLSGIPSHLLARAAAMPTNRHALEAIQRAAGIQGRHKDTSIPANVAPAASSVVAGIRTEDGGILVTLPLPPKELSPNARVHWARKQRVVREYREMAKVAAQLAIGREAAPRWERATVQATFYFRVRRRRDMDNLSGWCKQNFDGLADAGVVANDSGFTHLPVRVEIDRDRPRVELRVAHP